VFPPSLLKTPRFVFTLRLTALLIALNACAPAISLGQTSASGQKEDEKGQQLVREVMENEIQAQLHDNSLWRYRKEKQEDGKPMKGFEIFETKEGDLERLVTVGGRQLSEKEARAEDHRLRKLISDPEEMGEKRRKEREDAARERSLLRIFPEAFQFRDAGAVGGLVRLTFTPRHDYHAWGHEAQMLHHMEGSILLDAKQKRLVEISGTLVSEVKFFGGMLGHLDKGGTFVVKQQDCGGGHWDLAMIDIQMNGKALLFKTVAVREKEIDTDYRPSPDVTLEQAYELLSKQSSFTVASSK
jgi:hypothetical protein